MLMFLIRFLTLIRIFLDMFLLIPLSDDDRSHDMNKLHPMQGQPLSVLALLHIVVVYQVPFQANSQVRQPALPECIDS